MKKYFIYVILIFLLSASFFAYKIKRDSESIAYSNSMYLDIRNDLDKLSKYELSNIEFKREIANVIVGKLGQIIVVMPDVSGLNVNSLETICRLNSEEGQAVLLNYDFQETRRLTRLYLERIKLDASLSLKKYQASFGGVGCSAVKYQNGDGGNKF